MASPAFDAARMEMGDETRPAAADRPGPCLSFGPFRLFPRERRLLRGEAPVAIGSRALGLLIALTERAGDVVPHFDLYRQVWPDRTVVDSSVRVHMAALRRLLGDGRGDRRYIVNIAGRGYAFVAAIARDGAAEPAPDPGAGPLAELPRPLPRMVGRDETVAGLAELIRRRRFVSIVGCGGIGKTTVAVAVAHALLPDFGQAVRFVDLAGVSDPGEVAAAVASAIGVGTPIADPLADLVAAVAATRLLLVLDNCEHVIDAAALLAERLHGEAPEVHLLVTSRETLRVEGEHIHWLRPLACPPDRAGLTAARALEAPAVQLFMERAAASGHAEPLSDADAPVVADMCRKLDGIALAIELAAGRVGTHGIRGTAALLNDRHRLSWQGRRNAAPRHRTIQAMLDWSFDLLAERDRQVLCRLAAFPECFSLAGAQEIASDDRLGMMQVAEALDRLVDKSLVWAEAHADAIRYRLHHLTRAYLLDRSSGRDGPPPPPAQPHPSPTFG